MTERETIAALRKQATRDRNARTLLDLYTTTTPEERKRRREADVERYRRRVEAERSR